MRIVVLGSAAGGGFPQWNCKCLNCQSVRAGSSFFTPRTQASIAVSADGSSFVLLNCSPDLRQQIAENPDLHPQGENLRSSPIQSVVLTNGDIDHIAGLLNLRESQAFSVYATERVHSILRSNSVFNVLNSRFVKRRIVGISGEFVVESADGEALGLYIDIFPVPGKVALFLENENAGPNFGTREGDTVGLRIRDENGASFYYLPGCASINQEIASRLHGAALVFFDGTIYRDQEMLDAGVGIKTGARMGHISNEEALVGCADLNVQRKIFIHINNTNPILARNSKQRKIVEAAGWEVAYDGQCITL